MPGVKTAARLLAEPLAWVLVPASRSLMPLCLLFVGARWIRVCASQGFRSVLRRGGRQLWRALLSAEIWFAFYTYLVAQGLQRPRWKALQMRGDKLEMLRKVMGVMDVVFGERSGRLRRAQSLNDLRESICEARGSLATTGDLLHAESLLRHWAHSCQETPSGSCQPECLRRDSTSSAASSSEKATLGHEQLIELKRAEVSAWFKGAPFNELRRGDIADLLACSFYSKTPSEVRAGGEGPELDALIDEMIGACEAKLSEGTSKHTPMRVGMDPIAWTHRPLVFYMFSDLSMKALTSVTMRCLGFHRHTSGSLRYWYRPGSGAARVFCHGVGLGVLPYVELLRQLSREPGPLFAIELEAIAMRIQRTVPSRNEVAANIRDMLHAWGFTSAHFVGHSFGTVVMAWVSKLHPALIHRASFLDPVVFLLCNPMMCYGFMYKQPRKAEEKLMHFFVSSELYMANMLSRHFLWHECVLWEEDLVFPEGSLLVLSGGDQLVPSHEVRRYMQKRAPASTEVVFLDDSIHGEFLLRPKVLCDLVNRLR